MILMNTQFRSGSAPKAAAKPVGSVDLQSYVGKYIMTGLPFPHIDVMVKDGRLFVNAGGQEGEVTEIGEDTFDASGRARITFVRDEQKKVVKLKMDAMGMTFEGPKE
jgi:cytochrome c